MLAVDAQVGLFPPSLPKSYANLANILLSKNSALPESEHKSYAHHVREPTVQSQLTRMDITFNLRALFK